jgi:hypothetical protein
VLKGKLASDGTFRVEKDGVMAKCPSKYDPAKLPPAGAGPGATSTSGTKQSTSPSGTKQSTGPSGTK